MVGRRRGRRADLDEALPARLGGVGARGVAVAPRRPLLHDPVVEVKAPLLVLPALQRVAEQLLAALARGRVGGVGAAVDPAAARLQRDDLRHARRQQVAVVADHQHRLRGLAQAALEPALGRDVEEVVGLVEQQRGRVRAEQEVEHDLLALAARDLAHVAPPHVAEAAAHAAADRGVPLRLQLIAAELAPLADRDAHLHARVGVADRQRALGAQQLEADLAQARRGQGQQHLAHRLAVVHPDRLRHVEVAGVDRHGARRRPQPSRQDLHERALADAVGADQRRALARRDVERDVAEEGAPAGVRVLQLADRQPSHVAAPQAIRRRSCGSRTRARGPRGATSPREPASCARRRGRAASAPRCRRGA